MNERLSSIELAMDETTGELTLRYEHYEHKSGWVHESRVVSAGTLRDMQVERSAIAGRNPDMEPADVTLTMLKRWAVRDLQEKRGEPAS